MLVHKPALWTLAGLCLLPMAPAFAQLEPTSTNDRTTTTNQDPNPKNPVRPPKVDTGVGSPDSPADGLLNEGSTPLGGEAAAQTGKSAGQNLPPQGFNNFGFAGGTMQTLRLSDLLNADLQLDGGQAAGTVSDVVLGPNGNILYLMGTDQSQQNLFTVPVSAANFDANSGIITLPMTPQQFGNLPTYTRDTIPNFNSLAYQRQLYTAYGLAGVRVNAAANAMNTAINNAAAGQKGPASRPNAGRGNPSGIQPPNADLPAPGSAASQRNADAANSGTGETKRATVGNPAGVGNQSLPGAANRAAAAKTAAGTPKASTSPNPGLNLPNTANPAARNNRKTPPTPSQRNQLRTPPLNQPVQGNNAGQPAGPGVAPSTNAPGAPK